MAGDMGVGPGESSGGISALGGAQGLNLSPELIAQVSSLLSLPTAAPTGVGPAQVSPAPPAVPTCDGDSTPFTSQGVRVHGIMHACVCANMAIDMVGSI